MPIDNLTAAERETVVNSDDGSDIVKIWTAQKPFITLMKAHKQFTLTKEGYDGSTAWAEFTIPADEWNPTRGAKRKMAPLTEERKAQLARQLKGES